MVAEVNRADSAKILALAEQSLSAANLLAKEGEPVATDSDPIVEAVRTLANSVKRMRADKAGNDGFSAAAEEKIFEQLDVYMEAVHANLDKLEQAYDGITVSIEVAARDILEVAENEVTLEQIKAKLATVKEAEAQLEAFNRQFSRYLDIFDNIAREYNGLRLQRHRNWVESNIRVKYLEQANFVSDQIRLLENNRRLEGESVTRIYQMLGLELDMTTRARYALGRVFRRQAEADPITHENLASLHEKLLHLSQEKAVSEQHLALEGALKQTLETAKTIRADLPKASKALLEAKRFFTQQKGNTIQGFDLGKVKTVVRDYLQQHQRTRKRIKLFFAYLKIWIKASRAEAEQFKARKETEVRVAQRLLRDISREDSSNIVSRLAVAQREFAQTDEEIAERSHAIIASYTASAERAAQENIDLINTTVSTEVERLDGLTEGKLHDDLSVIKRSIEMQAPKPGNEGEPDPVDAATDARLAALSARQEFLPR